MSEKKYKYIFGPVYSWRLGMSLGIDPISTEAKGCSFDCAYCQLGPNPKLSVEREEFVKTQDVVEEIKALPPVKIDYITFSGRGEPTLASNLGEMIRGIKQVRQEKIAVITNATLMNRKEVQDDLALSDFVLAKLDAHNQDMFEKVNNPAKGLQLQDIIEGIKTFKKNFKGKLALQMMFVEGNQKFAKEMANIAQTIYPDEIQINTPLRPSAVAPLSEEKMFEIKKIFSGLPVISVYDAEKEEVEPLDVDDTRKRHGDF